MNAEGSGAEDGKSAEHVKDLLLEDYRYRSESLWKNEQSGETRLNLYIGFATLVIGALVTLGTDEGVSGALLRPVALASLAVLFALGLITLMRMLTRNEHTDLCKRGLDSIRQVFKDHFDRFGMLVDYYPVALPKIGEAKESKSPIRRFGGLSYTVAAINSALLGVIVVAATFPLPQPDVPPPAVPGWIYWMAAAVALAAFAVQVRYIRGRESQNRASLRKGMPTHAGGAVYRIANDAVQYLLLKPKDGADEWLLPKGHIEDGEGHGEAALREVREEAGIVGRLCGFVARTDFKDANGKVDAKFYLIERIGALEPRENRLIKWHPFEDAVAALSFPESKLVLREAERRRCASMPREGHG
jgi:8-oxo-dGTP pyrophosphatase MutT (NUDIX family)